ncbi:putative cereblon [Operophtera brumata]|uniref:Putative cereblon n=1 Tax=Operophtera brumata TaxID=104452 RepID=A0A0L7KU80_OPEBR|nr:putative cereblon [Operophtera brumata]
MGTELQDVSGRNVLEAGWRGTVPCMVHSGCVFPGETIFVQMGTTVKMRLAVDVLRENELTLSGYGVLCEVFEAAAAAEAPARCKARAVHRCRVTRHVDLRGHSKVLCEVFEAAEAPARCKARAVHRCRVTRHVDLRGHSK